MDVEHSDTVHVVDFFPFPSAVVPPFRTDPMEKPVKAEPPIQVTEPFLPPLDEYVRRLEGIWSSKQLTNQGPLVAELEQKIKVSQDLDMPVHCMANGSLGLQIILKALEIGGEVITTPFSYVATSSCPVWEGCTVKFVDVDRGTLTIDPAAVEAAITHKTEAILATHVFGNPCDCEALEAIAKRHDIALIFDAAHAHGVEFKGKSILSYGDASMVSLHATKVFHACEGGYVVAKDSAVSEKVEWMRRFGHKGHEDYYGVGINAKMSELHAAMGLCVLDHLDEVFKRRQVLCETYDEVISGGSRLKFAMQMRQTTKWNHSYYPVLFDSEQSLLCAVQAMNDAGVFPRRYFYPSLAELNISFDDQSDCPVSHDVSKRILCLPLAASYEQKDIRMIAKLAVPTS